MLKSKLRKKILKIRKIKNKDNLKIDFNKVFSLIKRHNLTKKSIGGYFPVNYEVDDLEILKKFAKKNILRKTIFLQYTQNFNKLSLFNFRKFNKSFI